jgi:hypothetical protein
VLVVQAREYDQLVVEAVVVDEDDEVVRDVGELVVYHDELVEDELVVDEDNVLEDEVEELVVYQGGLVHDGLAVVDDDVDVDIGGKASPVVLEV